MRIRARTIATYKVLDSIKELTSEEDRLAAWDHIRNLKGDLVVDRRKLYQLDTLGILRSINIFSVPDKACVYTSYLPVAYTECRKPIMGIYRLNFENGAFYIGASGDVFGRYRKHLYNLVSGNKLSRKMLSYKGQSPTLEIIEECPVSRLGTAERYWIEKLNARDSLNTI